MQRVVSLFGRRVKDVLIQQGLYKALQGKKGKSKEMEGALYRLMGNTVIDGIPLTSMGS